MDGFKLECSSIKDRSNNLTYLHTYYDKVQLLNISLIHGQIRVKNYISYMCYNRSTGSTGYDDYWPQEFSNPPFTFSEKLNIFTVVGVNTLAYMVGSPVSNLVLIILKFSIPKYHGLDDIWASSKLKVNVYAASDWVCVPVLTLSPLLWQEWHAHSTRWGLWRRRLLPGCTLQQHVLLCGEFRWIVQHNQYKHHKQCRLLWLCCDHGD